MVGERTEGRLKDAILESSVFLAPALILAVQMSGKGFSNSFLVGGTAGLALVWAVGIALVFKFAIVDGLARFTLARGESVFSGLSDLPGPRNWGTWAVLAIYTLELMAYASIALFAGTVLDELLPGNQPSNVMAVVVVLIVLVMLLFRSLGFLERTVYFIIAAVIALMAYTLLAMMFYNPVAHVVINPTQAGFADDFMLLVGTGSGLSLLLYSEWVSEKIKRIPSGMSRKQAMTGVRLSLVFAFFITGIFSFVIMTVAAAAGTGSISAFFDLNVGSLPFAVPVFILGVGLLMFGIVYVGIDGRARAIARMIRRMGLTKMELKPLYRVLSVCFVAILLAALMIREPKNILLLISSFSSVLFALAGFALIYLNSRLERPYRAGKLWALVTGLGSLVFLSIAMIKERTFLEFGIPMLLRLFVIASALYLLLRFGAIEWIMRRRSKIEGMMAMALVFGLISIFGSWGSMWYDGALINFPDLGPIIAGALGGPVVGLMAGLLGGAYRYGMGGWSALAGSVAIISGGLVSGLFSRYWKGSLSYLKLGFVCILVESMHLFLYFPLLTAGYSFDVVLDTLANVTVPTMLTTFLGTLIFYYLYDRYFSRQKISDTETPLVEKDVEEA